MRNVTFNEFCIENLDSFYTPNIAEENQCTGYKELKRMIKEGIEPASEEETERWEKNPTWEEYYSVPNIKYLRFLHPILRPYIINNWKFIKNLEL